MRVWKVKVAGWPGSPGTVLAVTREDMNGFLDEMERNIGEEADSYEISVEDMTKEEFEALPEFQGF